MKFSPVYFKANKYNHLLNFTTLMFEDEKKKKKMVANTDVNKGYNTVKKTSDASSDETYPSVRLRDVLLAAPQVPAPLSSLSCSSALTNLALEGTLICRGRDSMLRCMPDSLG